MLICVTCACSSPAVRLDQFAKKSGLDREQISTTEHELIVWRNYPRSQRQPVLNVYLEGDGLPWILRYWRSRDPTPRQALMMSLMRLDRDAAIYVGRPCYNGLAKTRGCSVKKWTGGRYGPDIVGSMREAIFEEIRRTGATRIRLLGHSGGGALAMLLAEGLPQASAVVTLAGNLNVDGWTRLHGYTPLYSSLDPLRQAPLDPAIRQIHLLGQQDSKIPPVLVEGWIRQQPSATGIVLSGFDHGCCWADIWPKVLTALKTGNVASLPGRRI